MLLLDGIISAPDAETGRKAPARIYGFRGRTCIIVTHRPAAAETAGRNLIVTADRIGPVLTDRIETSENACLSLNEAGKQAFFIGGIGLFTFPLAKTELLSYIIEANLCVLKIVPIEISIVSRE